MKIMSSQLSDKRIEESCKKEIELYLKKAQAKTSKNYMALCNFCYMKNREQQKLAFVIRLLQPYSKIEQLQVES